MTDLPNIKLKTVVSFPGNIIGGVGIEATKERGSVTIDMAWNEFGLQSAIPTSPTNNVLTFDTATEQYVMIPSSLLGGAVAGIADAPVDGTQYARQSGTWSRTSRDIWPSILDFDTNAGTGGDDTAALQALVDYVSARGGGKAYLPSFNAFAPRTYRISSLIQPTAPIMFVGDGCGAPSDAAGHPAAKITKIVWTGGHAGMFHFHELNFGCGMEGILLDCANTAFFGVFVEGTSGARFKNVYIDNFLDYGMALIGTTTSTCSWNHFEQITIASNNTAGNAALAIDHVPGATGGNVCHCTFVNLSIIHCGATPGIRMGAADNLSFMMTYIWGPPGTTGADVYVDGGVRADLPNGLFFWHLEASTGGWVQTPSVTANPGVVWFEQSIAPQLNGTPLSYYLGSNGGAVDFHIGGEIAASENVSARNFVASGSPSTTRTLDSSGSTIVVPHTTGGTTGGAIVSGSGLLIVTDTSITGYTGLYLIGGPSSTLIGGGARWIAATTTPGVDQYSVQYDGVGAYRIYNGAAASVTFSVAFITTRLSF